MFPPQSTSLKVVMRNPLFLLMKCLYSSVPFKHLKNYLKCVQCVSRGQCMNCASLFTEKLMLGLVIERY